MTNEPGTNPGDAVRAIRLTEKLGRFTELWNPRVVAAMNGQHVKLAKLQGEFVWHRHADEDELFLVLRGALDLHLRDRIVRLEPGELAVVPKGVEHKPVAAEETHVLLVEPASTRNTGNVDDARTVESPEWI